MNIGILLAAGKSKRFGSDKLFQQLYDKPVIFHALQFLNASPHVDEIIVAVNASNKKRIERLARYGYFKKIKKIVLGGKTRFESLKEALQTVNRPLQTADCFIIHNAANPHATQRELYQCIKTLKRTRASGVAVGRPIVSTIKQINQNLTVRHTLSRVSLWETETPQVVRAHEFLKALKNAPPKMNFTDDLSVLEAAGKKTSVVLASPRNRKITTPDDLPDVAVAVGIGEDSHSWKIPKPKFQTISKNCLVLGGVKIPQLPALEADSDGDVVLHALCNALASALGKGSLGTYATRMAKKGIKDSKKYLRVIQDEMARLEKDIRHCAISIEAARPKIDPLANRLKKNLSRLLQIPIERIGITATSGKELTPFGRGEAIRCVATVMLE